MRKFGYTMHSGKCPKLAIGLTDTDKMVILFILYCIFESYCIINETRIILTYKID